MKKRDLFVFGGQSNMMGAAVYPPKQRLVIQNSYEYKHKNVLLGGEKGVFQPVAYPIGEFAYCLPKEAYENGMTDGKGNSLLADYAQNTYFCPAMYNLADDKKTVPFSTFSEANQQPGVSFAPFLVQEWETRGQCCAFAHMAKGSVPITYYFDEDMMASYNALAAGCSSNTPLSVPVPEQLPALAPGAAKYFEKECHDFFRDAAETFPEDDLSVKAFFWHQGESGEATETYKLKMEVLWKKLREIGFTHFFCIRVGFFAKSSEDTVSCTMAAQEAFCREHASENCTMLTRVVSYMPFVGQDEEKCYLTPPSEEFRFCRDSFDGFPNQHINEKGFQVAASHAAVTLWHVLRENRPAISEPELVRALLYAR